VTVFLQCHKKLRHGSSWHVTVVYGRLPRQSLISFHAATFCHGSFCSKSNRWRNPPASMITKSKIAVIPDAGYNRMIHCRCLLSSSPSNVAMTSLVHRHMLHLFATDHLAPNPTSDKILHHQRSTIERFIALICDVGNNHLIFISIAPYDPAAVITNGKAVQYYILVGLCMSDESQKYIRDA
jgi:hypothetical protein